MRKTDLRIAFLLAVLVAVIPAGSATAKTVNYTSKISSVTLSSANGYPNPGGTAVLVGSLKVKPFGEGALVDRVTITGHPQPNVFEFKGTEVDYYDHGTMRNTFTGTATVNEDGSQDLVAKGRFTGGTGRYKGATGKYKFSGHADPGSTIVTGGSRGTVTY